jgi:hypothetical protein
VTILGLILVIVLTVLWFGDEVVGLIAYDHYRLYDQKAGRIHIEVYYTRRLFRLLPLRAFTSGRCIWIHPDLIAGTPDLDNVFEHELVHAITQRTRYGRAYLHVYLFKFMMVGFKVSDHPLEREANALAQSTPAQEV